MNHVKTGTKQGRNKAVRQVTMDSEAKEITSQRVSLSGKGTEREEREWRDELIDKQDKERVNV